MIKEEEIETLAHNITKVYMESFIQNDLKKEGDIDANTIFAAVSTTYINRYEDAKKLIMNYIRIRKLEEEKKNPFNSNYVQETEHPKLTPFDDIEPRKR